MQAKLNLAASITKAASKQTYYTIRFLADRDRVAEAYAAYAYFRWMDDILDSSAGSEAERRAFAARQKSLLEGCYQGEPAGEVSAEEQMLVELVRKDAEKDSGLQAYLRNMMAVMVFDVERRWRLIWQAELDAYTHNLASAVTEAMHYFVGHRCYSPHNEARYLAVSAAHITHMLRDTVQDIQLGYYNIPSETLDSAQITPQDVQSEAFRQWVRSRSALARSYFKAGKAYLKQLESWRCRLAGFTYAARFEGILDTIEKDGYRLRPQYKDGNGLRAGLQTIRAAMKSVQSLSH